MTVDIRRMEKAELDELNRSAREWRERNTPAHLVTDAIPEPSQADIPDPPKAKTTTSTMRANRTFMRTPVATMSGPTSPTARAGGKGRILLANIG
jgi:hypothetical protein